MTMVSIDTFLFYLGRNLFQNIFLAKWQSESEIFPASSPKIDQE